MTETPNTTPPDLPPAPEHTPSPPAPPATAEPQSQPTASNGSGGIRYGRLGWGLVLLFLGSVLLLERMELFYFGSYLRFWPLVLVGLGTFVLVTARTADNRRSGLWLIALGGWFLVNILSLFGLWWGDSWPLLLIAAGVIDLLLPRQGENRLKGLWPLGIGLWLLVNTMHLWGFSWEDSWPLLLIVLGCVLVGQSLTGQGGGFRARLRRRRNGEA